MVILDPHSYYKILLMVKDDISVCSKSPETYRLKLAIKWPKVSIAQLVFVVVSVK